MAATRSGVGCQHVTTLDQIPATPPAAAPTPPKGFVPPDTRAAHNPVTGQQKETAYFVADELTRSTSYVDDFTDLAPPAATVGARLRTAKAWSDEAEAARAWYVYALTQSDAAWDGALAAMRQLKPEFDVAKRRNRSVGARYPQTRMFLDVWKVAAARGVVTKAIRKKAAKGVKAPTPADASKVDASAATETAAAPEESAKRGAA